MDYASTEVVMDVIADLTAELEPTDDQFSASLLSSKVIAAYRDVQKTRKYPSYYTDTEIESDMEQFYATIRNVALYDYNQVGMEFQSRNSENEVARTFLKRDTLFNGILPLSQL